MKSIQRATLQINNQLFGKYVLTRYALLYILRLILDEDCVGKQMIRSPERYVGDTEAQTRLEICLQSIVNDIVIDVNGEVNPLGNDFDYRDKLRDADWVKTLARAVVGNHLKLVQRGRIKSLTLEWEKRAMHDDEVDRK